MLPEQTEKSLLFVRGSYQKIELFAAQSKVSATLISAKRLRLNVIRRIPKGFWRLLRFCSQL